MELYISNAKNNISLRISQNVNIEILNKYKKQFEYIYNIYNDNPDSDVYRQCGAFNLTLFVNSINDYIFLLSRPEKPPLLLNTNINLSMYSDDDIINFIGKDVVKLYNKYLTRDKVIKDIYKNILYKDKLWLISHNQNPNSKSIYTFYFAYGNIMSGFKYYDILKEKFFQTRNFKCFKFSTIERTRPYIFCILW